VGTNDGASGSRDVVTSQQWRVGVEKRAESPRSVEVGEVEEAVG